METLVVNLYGGPSTGKSTTCAGVFFELKSSGLNCEMSLEWAKEKVWAQEEVTLANQLYVFGKQFHRIWRLLDKVDVIITDAPLLNSILYYQGDNEHFPRMVFEEHQKLNNFNVFLERVKPFNPSGRLQDEEQSKGLDVRIRGILDYLDQDYFVGPATPGIVGELSNMTLRKLSQLNRTV